MKKLYVYLFLVFFALQTPSSSDDIRDFQIEGMSIGDSLLDFISKDELANLMKSYYPNKKTLQEFFYNNHPMKYMKKLELTMMLKVMNIKFIVFRDFCISKII